MRLDQYYAYDAKGNKITADSPHSDRFVGRASPIFREEAIYNVFMMRWDIQITIDSD